MHFKLKILKLHETWRGHDFCLLFHVWVPLSVVFLLCVHMVIFESELRIAWKFKRLNIMKNLNSRLGKIFWERFENVKKYNWWYFGIRGKYTIIFMKFSINLWVCDTFKSKISFLVYQFFISNFNQLISNYKITFQLNASAYE